MKIVSVFCVGFFSVSPAAVDSFSPRFKHQQSFLWSARCVQDPALQASSFLEPTRTSGSVGNDDGNDAFTRSRSSLDLALAAPAGTLSPRDIVLMRDTLASVDTEASLASQVLYRLVDEAQVAQRTNKLDWLMSIGLNADDFLAVMRRWADSTCTERHTEDASNTQNIWTLFVDLEDLYSSGLETMKPRPDIFRTVLRTLAASRERGMDRRVWSVFERMSHVYKHQPDADMYGFVIEALAKSRDRGAADRAETILKQAVARFPPGLDKEGRIQGISVDSFNVVLTAWAKSGLEHGPERAEQLIVLMDDLGRKSASAFKPTVSSFTSLIDAYAQTSDWEGISQSERILNRMLDLHLEGQDGIEPNVASWTIVISGWARLSKKNFKNAAEKADRLLRRMEKLHSEGRISFAPDAIVYVTCINAFAFSKSPDGPARAQNILDEMHERYLDGDDTMKPSAKSIRVVVDAWTRSSAPNAMDCAEECLDRYDYLLDEKEHANDLREVYRAMLFGHCNRVNPVAAQEYLLDMLDKNLSPDSIFFDKVIQANTVADDEHSFERTQQVFDLARRSVERGDIQPTERIYTSYIRALTKGRIQNLANRAHEVLREMEAMHRDGNQGIAPTIFTYNAVLMACSEETSTEAPQPEDAFKIAVNVFNGLRSSKEGPDHVSFGSMLRCANLLPAGEQRDALVKSVFQLCCQKGFVNSFVVRDVQFTAPESLWRELLLCPTGEAEIERLPSAWKQKFATRRNKY